MTIVHNNLNSFNTGNQNNIENNIINSPFYKGVCTNVFIKNPKKPNSANSKVAKVKLLNNGLQIIAFIPGISRNLNQHSIVLVNRGNLNDLPGVNYNIISNNYDCGPVLNSSTSSSNYGNNS